MGTVKSAQGEVRGCVAETLRISASTFRELHIHVESVCINSVFWWLLQNFNLQVAIDGMKKVTQTIKIRLLPGQMLSVTSASLILVLTISLLLHVSILFGQA